MFTSHRGNRSDGKRFGGRGPRKQGFGDRSFEKPSFKATCADCGNSCTVPFRPNGSKPVLCSSCFHGNGDAKPFSRSRFSDREPREQSYSAPGAANSRALDEQLKAINTKLDSIIVALEALQLD